MGWLDFLDPNAREIRHYFTLARQVGELEPELLNVSDEEINRRGRELAARARAGEDLDSLLIECFALVREAARRRLDMRHYDVQLVGGMALHRGRIAEMKTGEGKTLVASLALVINALPGEGVHLVTANDYLARRDAGWMAPVYHLLGLSVGVIMAQASFRYDPDYLDETHPDPRLQHLRPVSRQEAYQCDITYGTSNEFGFDYLRDNMAIDLGQMVQRPLNYAIVDEVDSILIDEARTPLIISGQGEESTDLYLRYADLARRLQPEEDYTVDEKHKAVTLTEAGAAKVEQWTGIPNIFDLEYVVEAHQINQALKAKALFLRDRDYLVLNGEVVIVDEFTGRTMPGRRWSDGLHQAIEAKEGVKVQQQTRTLATITLQNYFRLYRKLAGMTGTALTEAEEFHKIYGLEVLVIPTNRPMIREDRPDVIYKTEESKFNAVIDQIVEMHRAGRPVLVGTVSVEKSERLARMLEKRGIPHNVLNAKQHEREAAIVAEAGQPGAVTIATNMAGRGTDIVLGPGVAAAGGLHIIGTERHESRRIDNQLRGRAGRQGDPGSSAFFISLEDDLMRIFGSAADRIGRMMDRFEVEPIEHSWVARSIENAQKNVEGRNFDTRKYVVEYDDVMNKQRAIIYSERRKVLEGADTRANIEQYVREIIEQGVDTHCAARHPEDWDLDGLLQYLGRYFPLAEGTTLPPEATAQGRKHLVDFLYDAAMAVYDQRQQQFGPEVMRQVERFIILRTIDTRWQDYLTQVEQFREGVTLRAYGQRDPLVEYKNEAFQMFNELVQALKAEVVTNVFRVQIQVEEAPLVPPDEPAAGHPEAHRLGTAAESDLPIPGLEAEREPVVAAADGRRRQAQAGSRPRLPSGGAALRVMPPAHLPGRNDPCWCGSGQKFKRCHGR